MTITTQTLIFHLQKAASKLQFLASILIKNERSFAMTKVILCITLAAIVCVISSFTYNTDRPPADPNDLAFPVAGNKSNIGSFWGDTRSGGKRKHEGIDIFAKKGTDIVAICDGTIVSVGNGGIGGKTVWLQPDDYSWNAYYAHLDIQNVYTGQRVSKGDIIGTVGNTGNAKYTPSHLHFGLYTNAGAINPLPYVQNAPKVLLPNLKADEIIQQSEVTATRVKPKPATIAARSKKIWTSSFPEKYVCKQLFVPSANPASEYFVTTRANVVRVTGKTYEVIGTFKQTKKVITPYAISLFNGKNLFISKDHKLLNESGQQIGTVLWKA